MNGKVDAFLARQKRWRSELRRLRKIILNCGLVEDLKWGQPCYTFGDKNVVLMHGFKEYCAILFFKGVLLKDSKKVLIQPTANVQAGRQARFRSVADIARVEKTLKTYVREAIELEKSGAKVTFNNTADFSMPAEFKDRLKKDAPLKAAFDALTPGRRRGYLLYLSGAKQAKTREARIEKCVPKILDGFGLHD